MLPRSIKAVQDEYLQALANASAYTLDISQGSFNYTLARANSSVIASQETALQDLKLALSLSTATGDELDRIGASYNIARLGASAAVGSILAISNEGTINIPNDTILTDLSTGLQYKITTQQDPISINDITRKSLTVECTTTGEQANLPAGTNLFSPRYPEIEFTVGFTRTASGDYCGGLGFGREQEKDNIYRTRIAGLINSYGANTNLAVTNRVASLINIAKSFVVRNSLPGVVELWVLGTDNLNDAVLEEVKNEVQELLPAGIALTVGVANIQSVDISLKLRNSNITTNDLETRLSNLEDIIIEFFDQLEIEESFNPQIIYAATRALGLTIDSLSPNQIVLAQPDSFLVLNKLIIS